MSRPKLPPRRQVILRIDERLLLELYTFRPKLQDTSGSTRYGALNKYFTDLLVRDIQKVKEEVRTKNAQDILHPRV